MNKHEKETTGEIVVENRFLKWLDNFWYHYKWHTIVVAFFLLVGVVCFTQCATSQNTSDLKIAYAGGFQPSNEQKGLIVEVLEGVSPDKNTEGAGSVIALNTFPIFTEDEIKQLSLDDDGNVHTPTVNSLRQLSKNSIDQFGSYTKTGDCAVWFVSEYVYQTLNLARIAKPLAEFYETMPEGAYDAYAVKLSETAIYRYYDALKVFPEDTLIVMPHSLVWGSSSDQETYAYFCEMFRAIVDFRAP